MLQALEINTGDFGNPMQLGVRPGVHSPHSMIETAEGIEMMVITAGEIVTIPLSLRDNMNNYVVDGFPDTHRFNSFAIGNIFVNGIYREVTFPQFVVTTSSNDFSASVSITSSGTFKLHVKEGLNSFKNSPITVVVRAGGTDPKSSVFEISSATNTVRQLSLVTYDSYGNPTSNADDDIRYYYDDDGGVGMKDKTLDIENSRFFSGADMMHVKVNGVEINEGIDIK